MRNPKLIDKLSARLPPPARSLLDHLLAVAGRSEVALYLVGGPLRDLLLEHPSLDLDIAVEGDAMALARDLAEATGARVVTHPRFGTATVRLAESHVDLITARSETYDRSGALPTVKPATIREDLLRRDFTINALALRLNGPDTGEVLDPAGGLADVDAGLIRALDELSFQDDATRILRAVRYATRLGFEIERQTLEWLKRDLAYLDTISATRIHHEFARILAEDQPEKALRSVHDHGVLTAVHPTLRFEREHAEAFARLRNLHPSGARAAYWPVLAWRLNAAGIADLSRRLALTRAQRAALEAIPALEPLTPRRDLPVRQAGAPQARLGAAGSAALRDPHLRRSALAELLDPFPLPALWAFAALTKDPDMRDRLLDYLTRARHERPRLTGDDLLTMGVPEGPAVGDILRRLRNAKLDGEVTSRADAVRLAERLLAGATTKTTLLPARPEALEG